jgi:hypothetical protein
VSACTDNTSTLAGYLVTLCFELRKPHENCQGISLFYNLFTCTEHTMYRTHHVQHTPCTEHTMYRTHHVQNTPFTEHTMYRTHHVQNTPCTEHTMCRTHHVQNTPCACLLYFISKTIYFSNSFLFIHLTPLPHILHLLLSNFISPTFCFYFCIPSFFRFPIINSFFFFVL